MSGVVDHREDPNAFAHNPARWHEFHGEDCQRCSEYRREQRRAAVIASERAVVEAAMAHRFAENDRDQEAAYERLWSACAALRAAKEPRDAS